MVKYIIKVKNASNIFIGEFPLFRNLKINKRLNNYGTASFEVPAGDASISSLIALRRFTVWIYRQENENDPYLVWAGEQALRRGILSSDGSDWAEIHCYDWLEQLKSRNTEAEVSYDGVDAGAIAWDLIDTAQSETNGDFGITEGEIEETIDRDRTYTNQNIYEAIFNLSNVLSGFDFEITNEKVFNVKSLIGVDRTNSVVLEYGINIASVTITDDFVTPINRGIVLGQALDESSLARVDRNDTDLQALYKIREGVLTEMDISELVTFQNKGDAMIRKYGLPLLSLDLTLTRSSVLSIEDFSLGDSIRIKIKKGIYDIDSEYRVFEWEVNYDSSNVESLSLVLGDFTNES